MTGGSAPNLTYRFTVPGIPGVKAAAEHVPTARGFRKKKNEKTDRFENRVAMAARFANVPYAEKGVPVALGVCAYWPTRNPRKTKPRPEEYKTTRPDMTNVIKAVEDGLTGVAYHDDSQVVRYLPEMKKVYAAQGEAPRVVVRIVQL